MASNAGLSKKHSPLQKAHYHAYHTQGRAEKNLIRRLKTRVRRNLAKSSRMIARFDRRAKKSHGPTLFSTDYTVKPDKGALKALKRLKVSI